MQSRTHNFGFDANYNFGTDNVFIAQNNSDGSVLPPISGFFLLLNGGDFLILDNTHLLLL
jgi:hypothetical protein